MKIYKNGYSDGSGKGTITLNDKAVLRTHWGCSRGGYGPTHKDKLLANRIVKILNTHEKSDVEVFTQTVDNMSEKVRDKINSLNYPTASAI